MTHSHSIYLDHAATTPVDARVLEAMVPYFGTTFGNASSIHAYGRSAKEALERARSIIASAIGAAPGDVAFTSGGTEADNLAIYGAWQALRQRGRKMLITSAAEHHAVLDPVISLRELGASVDVVPVDSHGQVDPATVSARLSSETGVVSIMLANNEVGTINPVGQIADVVHAHGAVMHSDAVQVLGKIPLRVDELHVDLLSLSAHKIYGPKGIGALYIRKGVEFSPVFKGGGQERGRRPGTENVALAVGFGRAVKLALASMKEESCRLRSLSDALAAALRQEFPFVVINGHPTDRLPHILNVSFDAEQVQLDGEMLVPNLDLEGIAVSAGSACTSGSVQPSHVLLAMGRELAAARASVRFSFGKSNTREDVIAVVDRMGSVINRMKKRNAKRRT